MTAALDDDWRLHIPRTAAWDGVLMCPPEHFAVVDEKNVFMRGQQGRVDAHLARQQWDALAATYRRLGVEVHELPAGEGLEDMVFCANGAVLVPRPDGGTDAVLSHMNHASRRAEVPLLAAWLTSQGFAPRGLPAGSGHLEGHGDVLVVPGRQLLLGGHGGRSERGALDALAHQTGATLVPLALRGEPFYHLDTCLAVLDEHSLLVHPPAFAPDALETLARLFPRLLEADPREAHDELACNVHALASGHVLHPAGATVTAARLADAGYTPVAVDVSEFHRSGGSVFCLRMDLPRLPATP